MNFLNRILSDLRDKRLWPVAALLLAGIIAVPVLLSSASKPSTPVAQTPAAGQLAPPSGVPVVDTGSTPAAGKVSGSSRDPFTQLVHGTKQTSTSGSGTPGAGTSTTPSTGAAAPSTTPSASTVPSTAPTATIPTTTPKPAPTGLTSTQSYQVKLAITNTSGGVDTIDPLERLSVLPSNQQPLLVELGVLKGGSRVLFAVQPGAVVYGPGSCIPGPVDCEVLSLGQDQTETLDIRSSSGIQTVALFAVTGIRAADHPSVAAADQARRSESSKGRALLDASSSSVLPLFQFDPSIGAVVDERNLTVGG